MTLPASTRKNFLAALSIRSDEIDYIGGYRIWITKADISDDKYRDRVISY
jgi:hypothetical protein